MSLHHIYSIIVVTLQIQINDTKYHQQINEDFIDLQGDIQKLLSCI